MQAVPGQQAFPSAILQCQENSYPSGLFWVAKKIVKRQKGFLRAKARTAV
jgi:hypothetical protein